MENREGLIRFLATFADEELICRAYMHCTRNEAKCRLTCYEHNKRECVYLYLSGLEDRFLLRVYERLKERNPDCLKPCCELCIHHAPGIYKDIPGSHVYGWWRGCCTKEGFTDKEIGDHIWPCPDWCPLLADAADLSEETELWNLSWMSC